MTGLNKTGMFECIMKLPSELPASVTVEDVLRGKHVSSNTTEASQDTISGQWLNTAMNLRKKRLLCVLDLYSYGNEKTEINLNKAFLVSNG